MVTAQGWTIEEAAKALRVSEKTVRRRIKDGTIKADQIAGKYGPEYRIPETQIAALRDRASLILIDDPQDKGPGPEAAAPSDAFNQGNLPLDKALDMIRTLQAENERLAGQIGFLQAKLMEAETKLRLLAAPRTKLPWWQRLFPWTKRSSRASENRV